MDSITQAVLGAAVGEAVAGRRAGRRAALWGAAFGTLPDLDVLVSPFVSEATALAFHRSLTHSLFFSLVAAPVFGLFLARIQRKGPVSWRRWTALVGLALVTHWMVDCLNTYGTQVFFPFSRYPVSLGVLFIIDPLYTLPILAGLLAALCLPLASRGRRIANYAGLALSTLYVLVAFTNKAQAEAAFDAAYRQAGIVPEKEISTPMPLNTMLWAGMAIRHDTVFVGLHSLLDERAAVHFRRIPRRSELLLEYRVDPVLQRLFWFSRGFYTAERENGAIVFKDIRFGRSDLWMGDSGAYLFRFVLVPAGPDRPGRLIDFRQSTPSLQLSGDLLERYWSRVLGNEQP